MYNTSADYKTYIKQPSRQFECKVSLGTRTFNNSDIIQIVPNLAQPRDGFSIGNTVSQSIDITLKNDGGVYASIGKVEVEIGLKIGDYIEYIPMGIFNIDDVTKTDYTVKLTCYDNMIKFETPYFSSLGNTPTLQQIIDELASITGVEFIGTVPNYAVTKLQGYTCREVLGYIASVCGGNAYITRDGKFTIVYPTEVDCTITADNYINGQYTVEDQVYKIGMITCQNKSNTDSSTSDDSEDYDSVNDQNTISVGDLASDTMELNFENPWVTTSILNDIYNKLKDFSYLGYKMKWQGDLALDPGDIITIEDNKNVTRKAYIYANKLTYTGGLIADTSAKGETKNSNNFNASGPSTKDIQRLSVQLLIAEKAIINKANIKDLQATNARIENLDASVATIDTALINYATVTQLDVVTANIANLFAADATINSALINKANIADLTATNANISNLSADVANISTLVNGNLTSANIQSLVLTSSKVSVDNGFIKNAMIESLDVTKITAGTLNTNKISVSSSDGGLVIAGATQQFKDKSGNVRLQLGQDATGDFNFILRSSDGTTTLIDGTGVHANAIADKLIKTNMVADSAIGSQQINYSSFVTGFNVATNTNYINASHVQVDLTGQTLDISFSNLNTTVNGIQTTTNTNTTSISAIQGQISTLISNTTITATNGTVTQLKDAYNGTVATVNSLSTTIGQHTTEIDANTGNITSINSSITSIQASLTSISASLSSTQSTVSTQSTQINTINTNLTSVTSTANTALSNINNLSIGGTNLFENTGFNSVNGYSYRWVNNNATSIQVTESTAISGYAIKITPITYPAGGIYQNYNIVNKLTVGKTYTVSFYAKADATMTIFSWRENSGSSYNYFSLTTSWQKFSYTFTQSSTTSGAIVFYSYSAATVFYLHSVKVESGNQATTWTPCPTDVDTSIASVNAAATTANTTANSALTTANAASSNVATLTTTVNITVSQVSALQLTTNGLSTTVSNVQTTLTNLSIGGRNLLLNTKTFTGWLFDIYGGNSGTTVTTASSVPTGLNVSTCTVLQANFSNSGFRFMYIPNPIFYAKSYTFSSYMYVSSGYIGSAPSIYLNNNNRAYYNLSNMGTWQRLSITVTWTSASTQEVAFALPWAGNGTGTIYMTMPKVEEGTMPTTWTPASEDVDSSITNVQTSLTNTINSNVSTINQTTNSISVNVSSLQSSVNTINTTLGNKADTTTVTAISNRTSTLESSVSGINASITTLNSNVSSVTTTANNAYSAINNLSVGGRNLIISSKTKMGYNIYNSGTATINFVTDSTTASGYRYDVTITALGTNGYFNCYFGPSYSSIYTKGTGKQYTISFKIKSTVARTWNIFSESANASKNVGVTTNYQTVSITGNSTLNYAALYIFNNTNVVQVGDVISFCDIKMEEGNQATTWTPAPEDTDSQITTINSSVTSLQSSVSVLQSQIALKVEQTNIDSAVTTINGQITATNASITSLQSSINLQLSSITSSVAQTVSTKNLINNPAFNNTLGDYQATNTITNFGIINYSTYTAWGYAKSSICDNALWIRYDMTGDNYVELKNLFAKVKPNTTYTLSYYYFLGGSEYTNPSSYIYERTVAQWNQITYSNPIGVGPDSLTGNSAWVRYTKTFTTQSTTDSIMLRFGFHQTHSSGFCEMLVTGVQLELGSTATNWVNSTTSQVGTSITQSTTDVMTAFNNISSYFQVNSSGATFGNISTGDYTVLGANGLKHHIGSTDYDYMYIAYVQHVTITIVQRSYDGYAQPIIDSYTFAYDSNVRAMLNNRAPKNVILLNYKKETSPDTTNLTGYYTYTDVETNGVTFDSNRISVSAWQISTGTKNNVYTSVSGGTVSMNLLILA